MIATVLCDISTTSWQQCQPSVQEYVLPAAVLVEAENLLPRFVDVGTGGLADQGYYLRRSDFGYTQVEPVGKVKAEPFALMMQEIKMGFGRTLSRLPIVFGVSRQTLYNWLNGETPKPQHQAKLRQLSAAARVFSDAEFVPNALVLDRTLTQGKTFLQLMSEGAAGADMATRLMQLAQRSAQERARLDALLGERQTPQLNSADLGTPSYLEDL